MTLRVDDLWQGDILSLEASKKLGIELSGNERAVVITHDCDLRSEADTHFEILVGEVKGKAEKGLTGAQSLRKLHLTYHVDENPLTIQLAFKKRHHISKNDLIGLVNVRLQNSLLAEEEKRTLKQWLAARYGRPAFPDRFEKHLRKGKDGKELTDKISSLLHDISDHLVGVFLDLGKDRMGGIPEGEPYFLTIFIVYKTHEQSIETIAVSKTAADKLKELLGEYFGDDSEEIIVEKVVAVADTSFNLADIRRMDQWRVDYISFQKGEETCISIADFPI